MRQLSPATEDLSQVVHAKDDMPAAKKIKLGAGCEDHESDTESSAVSPIRQFSSASSC